MSLCCRHREAYSLAVLIICIQTTTTVTTTLTHAAPLGGSEEPVAASAAPTNATATPSPTEARMCSDRFESAGREADSMAYYSASPRSDTSPPLPTPSSPPTSPGMCGGRSGGAQPPVVSRQVYSGIQSACSAREGCGGNLPTCRGAALLAIAELLCGPTYALSRLDPAGPFGACLQGVLVDAVALHSTPLLAWDTPPHGGLEMFTSDPCVATLFLPPPVFAWRVSVAVGSVYPEGEAVSDPPAGYFGGSEVFRRNAGLLSFDMQAEEGRIAQSIRRATDASLSIGGAVEEAESAIASQAFPGAVWIAKEKNAAPGTRVYYARPPVTHPMYNRGYVYLRIASASSRLLETLLYEAKQEGVYGSSTGVLYPADNLYPAAAGGGGGGGVVEVPEALLFLSGEAYIAESQDAVAGAAGGGLGPEGLAVFFSDAGVGQVLRSSLDLHGGVVWGEPSSLTPTPPRVVVLTDTVTAWWCGVTVVICGVAMVYAACGTLMYLTRNAGSKSGDEEAACSPPRGDTGVAVSTPEEGKEDDAAAKSRLMRVMMRDLSQQLILTGSIGLWLLYSWAYHRRDCHDSFLVHCVLVTAIMILFPYLNFPILFGCIVYRTSDFARRFSEGRSLTVMCHTALYRCLAVVWFVNFIILNVAAWRRPQPGCTALHYHSQVYLCLFYGALAISCCFGLFSMRAR